MKAFYFAAPLGAALLLPFAAMAQQAAATTTTPVAVRGNFDRDRNVTVSERPRPDYEAIGLPAGGFRIYPRVTAAAVYSDNVFGQETGEVSDVVVRISPEVTVQSDWSRHELGAYANARVNRFQDYSSENTTDAAVGVRGLIDVSRDTAVRLSAETARQTEARTSNNTVSQLAARPIRFDRHVLNADVTKEFNRLRLLGRADYQQLDFDNVPSAANPAVILLQDDRDRTLTAFTGRAEYAYSPATAFFVEAVHNNRDYKLVPVGADRSSSGYDVGVGVNFDLASLMRGEVRVGYLSQDYDGPFQDVSGLSLYGRVDWLPTQLLTINFVVDRSVEEATSVASAGYLSSRAQVGFDYELLRNLIISGQIGYQDDAYEGIERDDTRTNMALSARYFLNRAASIQAGYNRIQQDSKGIDRAPRFTDQQISVALILQR